MFFRSIVPSRVMLRAAVVLIWAATLLLPAHAAERGKVEAFLEVTGFGVALDSIALSAGDAPAMLGLQASDFGSEWTRLADDVFEPQRMRSMALDILEQALSDALLNHAADFYASPLGQKLVAVENASHMMPDDEARQAEGQALIAEMKAQDAPRLKILERMNEAIDSTGNAVRAVQEIQVRFLMAASYAGVLDHELDEGALRALIRQDEATLRERMRESGLVLAAYTYRTLSDADLRAYVAALETPQMQQVYELMNGVQYEVMANRFEALAARMAGLSRGQDL